MFAKLSYADTLAQDPDFERFDDIHIVPVLLNSLATAARTISAQENTISTAIATAPSTVEVGADNPDPIFAPIEAHRRAVAAHDVFCVQQDQLEDEIPSEKRQTDFGSEEETEAVETDDPRWIAFVRELERLYEVEIGAESALTDIVPTTLQGVRAILNYAMEGEKCRGTWSDDYLDPEEPNRRRGRSWYYFIHRNIVEALESVA